MDPSRNRDLQSSSNSTQPSPPWQLDLLMQKLRQKSKGTSLLETAKNVKASLVERRCIVDPSENQNCLDQLQKSINVNSLQTMVEKLEMVTRQQGLKFSPAPGTTGNEWYISTDMFYLEVLIDSSGVVQEVKIQHEGKAEQQSCPEIVKSLQEHNFADLAAHLEGLVSIYQLNADKKTKSKVFIALQALESDLAAMASTYAQVTDGELVVMKSLLGILQPRKGGHPVKLVLYISPYEFIDMETKKMMSTDLGTILENQLGMVATVSVQPYASQKLQMSTTVTITRTPDGKSIPRYGTLNATNSTWLQACFTVKLQTPIPICRELIQAIQTTTGISAFDSAEIMTPVLSLITKHVSNGTLDCGDNRGLYVALPGQCHHYFMTETDNLEGLMISNIPFTLASQLPQVIATLRQQLAFNTLVGSCVRTDSKEAPDPIVFEVNALSYQNLTVSFQHPLEDTLVTLEFDLRDVTHPQCHLHAIANASDIIPTLEEYACKVVHRTMSIPVTLRAVIRRWQSMRVKVDPPNPNFNLRVGSSFNPKSNLSQSDLSCAAESERLQNHQQHTSTQQQQIPGMVMNWANSATLLPNSSFTISPVTSLQTTFPNQTPMELVSPYITLSNFQNLSQLNFNPSMVNMYASQLSSQQQQNHSSAVLINLLDQVGQQSRKRKRKTDSNNSGFGSTTMPRPSPSPSPKSRLPSAKQSPKRRPSESSEDASPRIGTPNSGHLSELPPDGDPRWNIDITPVGPGLDTTFSKMLSSLSSEYQNLADSDMEIESDISGGKFPIKLLKKGREPPKRSMSLDSNGKDQSATIQSLFEHGDVFKPMVTPSLSITPVSTTSTNTGGNSILNTVRPGIEIIPLPNTISIPNSITVTPILPRAGMSKKTTTDEPDGKTRTVEISTKKYNTENRKRKLEEGSSKNLNFGSLQMKSINKSGNGAMATVKRSNSITQRTALPKSPSFGMSPGALALSKGITGGKPSVSTLKSVSASSSPSSSTMTMSQGNSQLASIQKPKVNREKSKQLSTVGPASKTQKLQQSSGATLSHHGLPIPKLEPIGNLIPGNTALKVESISNMKTVQVPKPTGMVGSVGGKKTGLQAVIDKLKSQHSVEDLTTKKEPGGKPEGQKGSTEIKKVTVGGSGGTTVGPGSGPGSEYMIKPGGGGSQGLKLTINKTKGVQGKDKGKSSGSMKTPGSVPSLKKGLTPNRIPSPKLIPPASSPVTAKKVKTEGASMVGPSKSPNMKGSPTSGPLPKTKSDGELDLSKKIFMSGSVGLFDGPKFDNKFQIPKKSRIVTTTPVSTSEKVEDLSMAKKGKESDGFSSPSPSSQTPPPAGVMVEGEHVERDPPTLTVAADVETTEKHDELPPILSAEIHYQPPVMGPVPLPPTIHLGLVDDYASPESPDPVPDELKVTPVIPTTTTVVSNSPVPVTIQIPPVAPDVAQDDEGVENDVISNVPSPQQPLDELLESIPTPIPGVDDEFESRSMPPPPPRQILDEHQTSPQTVTVPSVVPMVSVHIVHSPQPNSPARLLRSPLVVQSPHSHPSPYAIDDELMDEALIGGNYSIGTLTDMTV